LGKIASLAQPTSWITDPKGNAQLAGALWHSASTSFNNDPSKFIGNAAGTIGTMFIPGADGAAVAGDAGRAVTVLNDVDKVATITSDASKAATIAGDASKAATVTQDVGKAAAVTEDYSKAAAVTEDASRAGGAASGSEPELELVGKPYPKNPLPQVQQSEPDWCGAACGQMSADRLGVEVDQATLAASRHFQPETIIKHTRIGGGFQTQGLTDALNDVAPVTGRQWLGGTITQDIRTPEKLSTHLQGYIDYTKASVILRVAGGDHWIVVDDVLQDGGIVIRDPQNAVSTVVTPQELFDMGPTGDAVFSFQK
jgi:hypothetical protein